jgi:hypothetical protein
VLLGSLQAGHRHCSVSSSEGVVVCAVVDARRGTSCRIVAHWHVGVSSVVFAGSAPADLARALSSRVAYHSAHGSALSIRWPAFL